MELVNVRTRFAPSPTGMLHFGNANTALFNWLIARRYGGIVVLRVEDTDTDRSTGEFEKAIIDDLKWLGIDWDEGPDIGGEFGPYRQMERTGLYEKAISNLLSSGSAYRCYCSKEEIEADREETKKTASGAIRYSRKCRNLTSQDWERLDSEGRPFTIRFKTPDAQELIINDLIRGEIKFMSDEIDDFIIVRSNGTHIFLLCNAIDDAYMRISHVVRGEDHISNTPKQILINRALGLHTPEYLHTAMMLGKNRAKLSKRQGAVSVFQFREMGFLPETLVNYLAFLGWNPKDEREFFTLGELKESFSLEGMSKTPSIFDNDRLLFLNSHWMRQVEQVDPERVTNLFSGYMKSKGWIDDVFISCNKELLGKIIAICGDRIRAFQDIDTYMDFFFNDVTAYHLKGVTKHYKGDETNKTLLLLAEKLDASGDFDHSAIESAMQSVMDELAISSKKIIHPTRLAITGKVIGPGLFELMELLGKEKCSERIRKAVEVGFEPTWDDAPVG